MFALHRVITLDTLFGVVAGFAFIDDELDAADATVALVKHVEIIGQPVGDGYPRPGEGAGPISEEWNVKSVLCLRRRDRGWNRGHYRQAESKMLQTHGRFSLLGAGLTGGSVRPSIPVSGTEGLPAGRSAGTRELGRSVHHQ